MCRGFSKNQQRIIDALKYEAKYGKEWYAVGSLIYQIKHGVGCFNRLDLVLSEPSNVEKQSYWRSIRLLEKKGLVQSRMIIICYTIHNTFDWREHRGGRVWSKELKLSVEFKQKIVCAKHLEES
jgi:hypothetical protein